MEDAIEIVDMLFLAGGLGFSLLFSVAGVVVCPSKDFGLEFCKK